MQEVPSLQKRKGIQELSLGGGGLRVGRNAVGRPGQRSRGSARGPGPVLLSTGWVLAKGFANRK